MNYLAPSVLSADFSDLGNDIAISATAGAPIIHLDVMDGHFVPNLSFGTGLISSLRPHTKLLFDVHLMVTDPLTYLDPLIKAGADIITFHYESVEDPMATKIIDSYEHPISQVKVTVENEEIRLYTL